MSAARRREGVSGMSRWVTPKGASASTAAFTTAGLAPSAIVQREQHRAFTVTEPGGHRVPIQSSHVTGLPV